MGVWVVSFTITIEQRDERRIRYPKEGGKGGQRTIAYALASLARHLRQTALHIL